MGGWGRRTLWRGFVQEGSMERFGGKWWAGSPGISGGAIGRKFLGGILGIMVLRGSRGTLGGWKWVWWRLRRSLGSGGRRGNKGKKLIREFRGLIKIVKMVNKWRKKTMIYWKKKGPNRKKLSKYKMFIEDY